MPNIYYYPNCGLYNRSSTFWKSLVELLNFKPNTIILLPNDDYKKGCRHFLSEAFKLETLPQLLTPEEAFLTATFQHIEHQKHLQPLVLTACLENNHYPQLEKIGTSKGFFSHFLLFLKAINTYNIKPETILKAAPPSQRDLLTDLLQLKADYETKLQATSPDWFSCYRNTPNRTYLLQSFFKSNSVYVLGFAHIYPYQEVIINTAFQAAEAVFIADIGIGLSTYLDKHHPNYDTLNEPAPDHSIQPLFITSPTSELEWALAETKYRVDLGDEQYRFALTQATINNIDIQHTQNLAQRYYLEPETTLPKAIIESPLAQLTLNLINLATNGFTRQAITALLLGPAIEYFQVNEKKIALNLGLIQSLAKQNAVLSHAQHWVSLIQNFIQTGQTHAAEPFIEAELIEHELFFNHLNELINTLVKSQSVNELCTLIRRTMQFFCFTPEHIQNDHHTQTYYFAFLDYLNLFENSHNNLFTTFKRQDTCRLLSEYLKNCFYQIAEPGKDGFLYDTLETALAQNYQSIFVCNIAQGSWPSPSKSSIFMPEIIQKQLRFEQSHYKKEVLLNLLKSAYQAGQSLTFIKNKEKPELCAYLFDEFSREILKTEPVFLDAPDRNLQHRIAKQIEDGKNETPYQINELDQASVQILKNRYSNHFFSASELDTYHNCPHLYFFKYHLKLNDSQDWIDEVSASEWGTLIHDIFYHFFTQLKTQNKLYNPENFKQENSDLKQLLYSTAERCFQRYSTNSLYWDIKRDNLFGTDNYQGVLDLFIHNECSDPIDGCPIEFETAFDQKLTHNQNELLLKGKIDMVLKLNNGGFGILDFKTGSTLPSISDLKQLRSLQLPIYMLALSQKNYRVDTAWFYQVKDKKRFEKKLMAVSEQAKSEGYKTGRKRPFIFNDSYFSELKQYTMTLKNMILNGKISFDTYPELEHKASDRSKTCTYCNFRNTCRFENKG